MDNCGFCDAVGKNDFQRFESIQGFDWVPGNYAGCSKAGEMIERDETSGIKLGGLGDGPFKHQAIGLTLSYQFHTAPIACDWQGSFLVVPWKQARRLGCYRGLSTHNGLMRSQRIVS